MLFKTANFKGHTPIIIIVILAIVQDDSALYSHYFCSASALYQLSKYCCSSRPIEVLTSRLVQVADVGGL